MKIYFADTIQREFLEYNKKFNIKNHLESYWSLINKKNNINEWSIIRGNNANRKKKTT